MFSKISDKGFRKTSVPLAFHTSLRSVEKKYIYIYILLYSKSSRGHSFAFWKRILVPRRNCPPRTMASFLPLSWFTQIFFPPRLFIPFSFIGNTWPSWANISYNEQLESNGFFYEFFLSLIFLLFVNNISYLSYQNVLL